MRKPGINFGSKKFGPSKLLFRTNFLAKSDTIHYLSVHGDNIFSYMHVVGSSDGESETKKP